MTVSAASEIIRSFCLQIPQTNWNKLLYARSPPAPHKYIQDMWEFEDIDGDLGDTLLKNFTVSGPVMLSRVVTFCQNAIRNMGKKLKKLKSEMTTCGLSFSPRSVSFLPATIHTVEACLQRNTTHFSYLFFYI
jgi:hypothetical protein